LCEKQNKKTSDDIKIIIAPIISIIKMSKKIVDKLKFIVGYSDMLSQRLQSGTTICNIEIELLKHISYKTDPELFTKMRTRIVDVDESLHFKKMFNEVNININSEKYASYDKTQYDSKICAINVLNSYAWNVKHDMHCEVPVEFSAYIDIFNACYKMKYPDRTLSNPSDESTCILDMTFGSKTYQINMTFIQMCVIYELNKNGKMSATQLSQKLKITSLSMLGNVMNSLTMTKLVTRENGELNNPNIPYNINKSFSYLSDKVSIVNVYKKLSNPSMPTIAPNRNDVKLNMLIVQAMINVPDMTIDEVAIKISENDNATLKLVGTYTIEHIKFLINKLIRDKHVIEKDAKYTYQLLESESESENEESDYENECVDNVSVVIKKKKQNMTQSYDANDFFLIDKKELYKKDV
jgi:hypothetical protein